MTTKDARIDTYITNSADFAKPILKHLREVVHKACPEVEEKMKWGFPHFDYKGMMCSMAAFKQHCAFSFWKASLMKDKKLIANAKSENAMGHLGRITSLKDLPSKKVLISYITEAKKLNDDGVKLSQKTTRNEKRELVMPDYFLKALKKNKVAFKTFENFSLSHKREYIEWIVEAKTEETRSKRITTTIEWLSAGKSRNWKYMKK
jgi:uncharacterized protein YdeI (YjbR/CyaY-like superfamily)